MPARVEDCLGATMILSIAQNLRMARINGVAHSASRVDPVILGTVNCGQQKEHNARKCMRYARTLHLARRIA